MHLFFRMKPMYLKYFPTHRLPLWGLFLYLWPQAPTLVCHRWQPTYCLLSAYTLCPKNWSVSMKCFFFKSTENCILLFFLWIYTNDTIWKLCRDWDAELNDEEPAVYASHSHSARWCSRYHYPHCRHRKAEAHLPTAKRKQMVVNGGASVTSEHTRLALTRRSFSYDSL